MATAASCSETTSYILLSDIHLGADLVDHVRPWSRDSWLQNPAEVDRRLEDMFDHYVAQARGPIRFVIAGDFVDFIGMSILPLEGGHALTDEELRHGLGSTAEHSATKVRAVAKRHARAFAAFARALIAGHTLIIVRGNHDIEWHWSKARRAFVEELCQHATNAQERAAIRGRVEFHAWFYYVPGLLYVEHGHEFDPMCSYGDPLLPVCARDPRRIRWTPSDVLMRYVARPTKGLSTAGHEHANFLTYLQMARSFGVRGGLSLFSRFMRAAGRLLRGAVVYRIHSARIERMRRQRFRALARKLRLHDDVLSSLLKLHVAPVAQSVFRVAQSLYLDRLLLIAMVMCVTFVALATAPSALALQASMFSAASALAVGFITGHGRNINPSQRMRCAAREIAAQLGVRYVVMGHTHEPRFDRVGEQAFYVNLGNWGEDELHEDRASCASPAPSSFLEIQADRHATSSARLLRWQLGAGPALLAEPRTVEAREQREREQELRWASA